MEKEGQLKESGGDRNQSPATSSRSRREQGKRERLPEDKKVRMSGPLTGSRSKMTQANTSSPQGSGVPFEFNRR